MLQDMVVGDAAEAGFSLAGLSLAGLSLAGLSLADVLGTMGVALKACTLPGRIFTDRFGPTKMEVGLGIHGEPGAHVTDIQPVEAVVSQLLNQILSKETNYLPISRGERVVLMVNGLGGTPLMELKIAAGKVVPQLMVKHGLAVDRVYTGSFMNSLDMEGLSISIMRADRSILQRLDAETKAPYWPVGVSGNRLSAKTPVPIPRPRSAKIVEPQSQPLKLTEQGQLLELVIVAAATALIHLKDTLYEWDSKVGDGDCGSTMYKGAKAVLEDMKNYPLNDAAETVGEIGSTIGKSMGGTSGIIYSILCKVACAQLKTSSHSVITSKQGAKALASAIDAVSKYGGAKVGYRTLLDALIPALSSLEKRLSSGDDPATAFLTSSQAALDGAESTKKMRAKTGHTLYVPREIQSSVPDPGAFATASWYRDSC